ncbi:PREDICTED: poly [ADP-ribose] polymerase 4-like, partial [Phaethon lepturus]|uniref:poly [ADP-ribose] polymerase 4-like n=1 Tax=Phaethon lepturus TaxID=97097 RepID=UPI0005305B53
GFSVDMSIEMPSSIERIHSWTHKLKIKKTDCKAVIKTVENSSLDVSGFVLDIWISQVYLPRMWVEKHPNKMSEACMLVFQPEFETAFEEEQLYSEIIILLDCSNSMAGSVLHQAKQIALHVLELFCFRQRVNVVKFGTNFTEFSSFSTNITNDLASLKEFITSATATLGNTDLWKTLRYLSLLFPSQGHRNILLISDGHIQNESVTFQIVKDNVQHTRLFTCGVGSMANRHMLRSLSQYGAGAFEYFDPKSKYNWEAKIQSQVSRILSPGCSSVSIKWQQFNTGAPEPMQAPAQIQSLFNNDRLLVYGFIPDCTQATLRAVINDQELQTVVSTTELQKTTGTVLHKLAARAFINDYEDGILHENETEHEMKKQTLKNMIIHLSLENSIISQFTSFVAVEKRDANETCSDDAPNILEIITQEDVDFLPYMDWDQRSMESGGFFSEEIAFALACSPAVGDVYSADFLSGKGEPESFQFQPEEVPVSLKSISRKSMVQGFLNVSEPESSICSLRSNFSSDRDITKETSSGTRSPSLYDLHLLEVAEPFSSFGFKPKPGGGIDLTEQKSLQTPAFTKSDVCVDVPEPALPPPPCASSSQKLGGCMKQVYSSCVAPMQGLVLCGSPTPTCRNSEKTNVEKQVIPKFPIFQANRKEASPWLRCKKKAEHQCDVTAPEEGFTEEFKVVEPSRCFITTEKERIQQRIEWTSANWKEIFALQNQDGSWNLSPQLGKILKFDVDHLINNFLIRKGIQSLGPNGKEKLLQLIATLLVLQFIRCTKELKGIVFKTLMKLDDSSNS